MDRKAKVKWFIIILMVITSINPVLSQKFDSVEVITNYLEGIPSNAVFINEDTIKPYEYKNTGGGKVKGQYIKNGTIWSPYGLYEEWYQSGEKKLETYTSRNLQTKYINMWSEDGSQILKNGNGYYYIKFPNIHSDSIVYSVQDSVFLGKHLVFKRDSLQAYYLYEKSTYNFKKGKVGKYLKYYKKGQIREEGNHVNGIKSGLVIERLQNGRIKSKGEYISGKKDGNWVHRDEKGSIIKSEQYRNEELSGNYLEYHSNGKIKIKGQYIQVKGNLTIMMEDEFGDPTIPYPHVKYYPKKDGQWLFYDEQGIETNKISYKEGVELKSNE